MPKTTPTPHPDDQLPAPLRWATRLFSSWWFVAALAVLVVGYTVAAYVPVGGCYLWQHRLIDAHPGAVRGWVPFHVLLVMLACAVVWTVLRRRAWRWRNLGWFLAALGLAGTLIGQSVCWRYQTRGLLPVQDAGGDAVTLQTRYLDPAERILYLQFGQSQPVRVPLDALPRWHDRLADTDPRPLHTHARLQPVLNRLAEVHIVGYIADGELVPTGDDASMLKPAATPPADRAWRLDDAPLSALLGVRFTTHDDAGTPIETLVWLPFDLAAGQRPMPPQSYDIPGLGRVMLAFTMVSHDLGFAVAAEAHGNEAVTLKIMDTDPATRQIIPPLNIGLYFGQSDYYRPVAPHRGMEKVQLTAGPAGEANATIGWVTLRTTPAELFVLISAAVTILSFLIAGVIALFRRLGDHAAG